MIAIGRYNELEILRETSVGLFLGDEEGEEDVLLPRKYCPEKFDLGDKLTVFVYRDFEDRKIATNLTPKAKLHDFAFLECTHISNVGAFLDWGLEKDLMVPFREQRANMEEDRWYVVYIDVDEETDRLYASNKIDKYLDNEFLSVEQGEEVDLIVTKQTDLGFNVIVENMHKGLLYLNDVFTDIRVGQSMKGYVKKIREDNKLDITLQPPGYKKAVSSQSEQILQQLEESKGYLPFSDKSSPDAIYAEFKMSKKAFKKAIGSLYKERKIEISKSGIKII